MATSPTKQTSSPRALIAVIAAAAVLLGAGIWYLEKPASDGEQGSSLAPEAKAYVRNLQLSEVSMKSTSSFLNQSVVEIQGKITNAGDRVLRHVEINCVFYDAYGQVILRERQPIVRNATGLLHPGDTREFRLAFDNLPETWNRTMPQLVIAQLLFG